MQEQSGAVKHRGGPGFLRYIPVKIILTIAILAAVFGAGVGVRSVLVSGNKLTRLGFEDIGELATQAAYCTEVNVTEGAREIFGLTIPFTQSKYVYSYDVVIKAGLDFGDIDWTVGEDTITVRLPEIRILSSEIDLDSFRVGPGERRGQRPAGQRPGQRGDHPHRLFRRGIRPVAVHTPFCGSIRAQKFPVCGVCSGGLFLFYGGICMRILLVEPGKVPRPAEIEGSLESI